MSKLIDVRDLSGRWEEVLASASAGDEIIVTDGDTPRALLVPLPVAGERILGLHRGAMEAEADFDSPLSDDYWVGQP